MAYCFLSILLLSFGYVDFTTSKEAKDAMAMTGTEMCGRELTINHANTSSRGGGRGGFQGTPRREHNPPSSTLFVKNLSYGTTEDTLYEHFDGCSSARIVTDRESGESRG